MCFFVNSIETMEMYRSRGDVCCVNASHGSLLLHSYAASVVPHTYRAQWTHDVWKFTEIQSEYEGSVLWKPPSSIELLVECVCIKK